MDGKMCLACCAVVAAAVVYAVNALRPARYDFSIKYWNDDRIQNVYVLDRRDGDLYVYTYINGGGLEIVHFDMAGDAIYVNPNEKKK